MIPKHANPSALLNSLTVVSRAALREDAEEDELAQTEPQHAQMLARLENILKRSIEVTFPQVSESPRKKKRPRVEEEKPGEDKGEREEILTVPFRLLSGTTQPKGMVLTPKARPQLVPQGPVLEDTPEEASRRASRAQAVAVDFTWVMNESAKPSIPLFGKANAALHVQAESVNLNAPLLLLETTKSVPPKPPRIAQSNPNTEIKPSPHAHDISYCPVVQVKSSTSESRPLSKNQRRRRKKHRESSITRATFWRAPPDIGGKALGYAWGYAGSHPLQPGETVHYTRDNMKKAEYEGA